MALGPDNKLYVNVGAPATLQHSATTGRSRRLISTQRLGALCHRRAHSVAFDFHR